MATITDKLLPLARSCRSTSLRTSPSISVFYFHQNLSTLTEADNTHATSSAANAHSHYPNLFAEFASTKFNLSSSDIARMCKANPSLERLKTLKIVEQFVDMLKGYGCTQRQIAFIMKQLTRCVSGLSQEGIEPKILLLRDLGIQGEDLAKVGVDKGSKMYIHVLMLVAASRLETLEAKIDNLQQCGLALEETMELFRVLPFSFHFSQKRVRQNMDYIVNDMELPANSVLQHRHLLKYNLKVVKPRVIVLKRIQSLNNLGHLDIRGLGSILSMSEAKFVNKIIKGHPESRLLNEIYQEVLTDASATTKAGTKSSIF